MKGQTIRKTVIPGTSTKTKLMRVFRFVVYAVLLIVMARGVYSFFKPGTVINQSLDIPVVVSSSAQSFAEAFAQSYYTFDNKDKEAYTNNLELYVAKGLLSENVGMDFFTATASYSVRNTLAWKTTQKTETTADIDVRVEMEQRFENGTTQTQFQFLRVPIAYNGSSYFVNDYPTVLPKPAQSNGDIITYPDLSEATEDIVTTAKQTIEDFLVAYATDTPTKLKYFMADGQEITGYEGMLSFEKLSDLRVFLPSKDEESVTNDSVTAYATVIWSDRAEVSQQQHYTFHLIYKEDRWYIDTFQGGFH